MAARGSTPDGRRAFGIASVSGVGVVAATLVLIAALRSTMGLSFVDSGYYAAATLRLAQGAHLFADEMYVQSLGFLVAVPFAKLWTVLFSTTGLVVALRLLYVALASGAGFVVYRMLRPSFGPWPALAAAAAPLLAPAYNLLAVSYNTMAALGLALAGVLAFAALRDGSRRCAALAGAAAAFAAISYPPLVLASFTLLTAFWWLGRGRRLVLPMLTGAAVVVAVFLAWLATQATVADLRATADFVLGNAVVIGPLSGGGRIPAVAGRMAETLLWTWGLPMWLWFAPSGLIAVASALPTMRTPERARVRAWLLAALPLTLLLPVIANSFAPTAVERPWTFAGNFLTAFVMFTTIPLVAGFRDLPESTRRLSALTLPTALVGAAVVFSLSSAGLYVGSQVVGLIPLSIAAAAWWAATIEGSLGMRTARAAVVLLLAVQLTVLFGATFDQPAPLTLRTTIRTGILAGVRTNPERAETLAALEGLEQRWARPGDRVLFVGYPGGYLALRVGVPLTNATWLDHGPFDGSAISYFDRIGRWPDLVFVGTKELEAARAPGATATADPLLFEVLRRYRLAEVSAATGLTLLSRR